MLILGRKLFYKRILMLILGDAALSWSFGVNIEGEGTTRMECLR
jgi:hypothetical protein